MPDGRDIKQQLYVLMLPLISYISHKYYLLILYFILITLYVIIYVSTTKSNHIGNIADNDFMQALLLLKNTFVAQSMQKIIESLLYASHH